MKPYLFIVMFMLAAALAGWSTVWRIWTILPFFGTAAYALFQFLTPFS